MTPTTSAPRYTCTPLTIPAHWTRVLCAAQHGPWQQREPRYRCETFGADGRRSRVKLLCEVHAADWCLRHGLWFRAEDGGVLGNRAISTTTERSAI